MISLRNIFRRVLSTTRPAFGAGLEAEDKAHASPLLRLPPELLLLIASMLPAPSAACLALCNRYISHSLGHGPWESLQSGESDILGFLSCLVKDLPKHFVCQECVCLHRVDAIKWPRVISHRLGPLCTWMSNIDYSHLFLSWYRLHFVHIYLAMKQHHSGTDIGFPLEAFQHLEVKEDAMRQKITLLSVNALIISGELLMRSQTWVLLPWNKRDEYINELAGDSFSCDICAHTRHGPVEKTFVPKLVRSVLDQLKAGEKCQTQTLKCHYCWMDYTLNAIDFGERGFALITTRWINLGAGLDVADTKWQSHIALRIYKGVHQRHFVGEIRAAFEDHTDSSLEELTADNHVKLFSKRKKRLVWKARDDGLVWKCDQGTWWYLAPSGPPDRSFWESLMDP